MCSPDFSFFVDKNAKSYMNLGKQSHTSLADVQGFDEDKMLQVNYKWAQRKWEYNPEETQPFTPKQSHIAEINRVIAKNFGDWKKALKSLKAIAVKDEGVFKELPDVLTGKGLKEWQKNLESVEAAALDEDGADVRKALMNLFDRLFSVPANRVAAWR